MRFFDQFTTDQMRAQYARNAKGLERMAQQATRTGRKVGGFTADQLRERVLEFQRLAREYQREN